MSDPPVSVTLDSLALEQLAEMVAAKLISSERERWVTADVVAVHLGVDRDWIYANASRLAAIPLGEGPKPRLRFRLDLVDRALVREATYPEGRQSEKSARRTLERKRRRRGRLGLGAGVELLPVRGPTMAADEGSG